jgi:hypothetical protein
VANVVEEKSDGLEIVLAISTSDSRFSDKWVLDSAHKFHMFPKRDWFSTYKSINGGSVLMRDNATCNIAGIGTIIIRLNNGIVRILMFDIPI